MKRELFFLSAVLLTASIFGQATETMSHQVENRNSNKDLVASSPVGVGESILQGADSGTTVSDETGSDTGETYSLGATHYVGEYYGGGIVFYVDEEGKHGLITKTIDKGTRQQQKSEANAHINSLSDGITTGKFNTYRINAVKGAVANDVQVVEDYQDASLSDWYLPTRYDLIKMYQNRAVIGGYSEFARGWKSAEVHSINEWFRSFTTGSEFRNGKDNELYIRVIREF